MKNSSIVFILAALLCTSTAFPQTIFRSDEVDIHAPYVPTPYSVVNAMLSLARLKRGELLMDLGCGDGRIVIQAAKQYGARGVGIDVDPQRIAEARANAKREGVEQLVRFEERNVYDTDVSGAKVVTLYLLQNMNIKLSPMLKSQLKPGARIVSHSFDMGSWKPAKTQAVGDDRIFLWKIRRRFWPFQRAS